MKNKQNWQILRMNSKWILKELAMQKAFKQMAQIQRIIKKKNKNFTKIDIKNAYNKKC